MKHGQHIEQRRNGEFHITVDLAALICGVSPHTYRYWIKETTPPPYDENNRTVPLKELGEWIRAEQVLKRGRGGSGFPYLPNIDRLYKDRGMPGIPKDEHPETRLKRLQADKLQLDIDKIAGTLVPVEEVHQTWSTIVTRVKTKMLGIPTKLAPLVTGQTDQHEVQELLSDSIHEALESLADNADGETDL